MARANEAGPVYRRCGCRCERTGRQLGVRCDRLAEVDHGRWYFAVQLTGVDDRRVRVRRGGFTSRAEAERACWSLRQVPGHEAAGMWTLQRWLEFWLSENEGRLRPSTMVTYRGLVNDYLIPQLGHVRMRKLRTRDAQRAMDRISHRHVRGGRLISPGTLNGIRAVLRSALSAARRHGVIDRNPGRGLRLPNGARPRAVVWDAEREKAWNNTGARPRVAVWGLHQVGRFLESVQADPLFALWWLVALRGPRRGEVAGLRWEDINLIDGGGCGGGVAVRRADAGCGRCAGRGRWCVGWLRTWVGLRGRRSRRWCVAERRTVGEPGCRSRSSVGRRLRRGTGRPATARRSRPTSTRPLFNPSYMPPWPRRCSGASTRSTSDLTGPSVHSSASVTSNRASAREVRQR